MRKYYYYHYKYLDKVNAAVSAEGYGIRASEGDFPFADVLGDLMKRKQGGGYPIVCFFSKISEDEAVRMDSLIRSHQESKVVNTWSNR
ncbi:hypothetical protein [Pseudobacteriovorax antillogorgiicola]|uniref:Uncharacterized protein n=1 Tax=Pseudobacteriovorax antillogorgiicola TaxID=1513793 RepID=A0A1Y6CPK2_9BACT|nr:hypothetical protein [Pseudobacteriovorax antillogorgiicola]TCS44224.1 hypothetical protein EDD56_13424 [Pseudobacteriovorax antillogorgiicola]SMF80552.1 hypothetical protein SAMN06296036_13525 [Pseudobacteriovorax antillogorgiicola]